jgi:general secretion pathway protein G
MSLKLDSLDKKRMARRRRQAGFTLLELLIVVIILGLLAALVGPRLFGTLDKAKKQVAKTQIELLSGALDQFRLDVGRYPTTDEGLDALVNPPEGMERWNGPYLEKGVPKDPWGHAYVYTSPGEHGEYDMISLGLDGEPGGEGEDADITSWQ